MTVDLADPPELQLSQPELARRRAHLVAEIERGVRARRGRRWKLVIPVAAAAAVAVAAVLFAVRPAPTQMTLVDQALAALGKGPTIHVVLQLSGNTQLLDAKTGKTRSLSFREEFWADPKLGTLFISSLSGRVAQRAVFPRGTWGVGVARWRPFISGYRKQLERGTFHVVGHGSIDGNPVEWISTTAAGSPPNGRSVEEVAISTATYRPLALRYLVNGRVLPGRNARIIRAESAPRRPSLFAHAKASGMGGGVTSAPGGSNGIPTTIAAARRAMTPDPIVPRSTIDGLERTWTGLPAYLLPPANSYKDQVNGLTLYYGSLDGYGYPRYSDRYVAINELPSRHAADILWGPAYFRRGAAVVITPGGTRETTATIELHGLFITIQASDRRAATAAVRALAR